MGVGAALIMPATLSIIANVFTGEERGKAIAIWAALAAVGIGLGPLAGGLLLEWFDWSAVFLVNVPFAVVALLLGIRYVPESRDPQPGSFDLLGAALSDAGFSILVYAIIEAPERGWTSGVVLGSLAASVALLGAFLWWERRVDEPMLDLGFFRSARFSVGTVAVSVAFFALFGSDLRAHPVPAVRAGYRAIQAGAVMSPMALGLMMGAGSSSKAVHRLGQPRRRGRPDRSRACPGVTLALGAGHRCAGARRLVLRACAGHGLGHGSGHRSRHRRSAGRQVRRRLRHQHRRADGLGRARRRRDRLARQLPLLERRRRLAPALPHRGTGGRRRLDRRRQRDRRPAPTRAASGLLAATGDAFTQAMGFGLLLAAVFAATAAVIVLRFLPAERTECGGRARSARADACWPLGDPGPAASSSGNR